MSSMSELAQLGSLYTHIVHILFREADGAVLSVKAAEIPKSKVPLQQKLIDGLAGHIHEGLLVGAWKKKKR